ncbi:MAG: YkgJ family cysteine cluster protein [Chthoniobacterales bacterium]
MSGHLQTAADSNRLCQFCGLCCDGSLFFSAKLQPEDNPRTLASLGLRIKRRKGELHMLQPCTALQNGACRVYQNRPFRCRKFDCKQLQLLEKKQTTHEAALQKIFEAKKQLARLQTLLEQSGDTREQKSLSTRYETLFTEPLDPSPQAAHHRQEAQATMQKLEAIFCEHFRTNTDEQASSNSVQHSQKKTVT